MTMKSNGKQASTEPEPCHKGLVDEDGDVLMCNRHCGSNASTEPMHCDHECVCWFAYGGMRPDVVFEHPCRIPCKHDTRARGPVTAPCGNVSPICSAMEIKKYPGDRFNLCKSSQPCTHQTKSSDGATTFCDHTLVVQQAPATHFILDVGLRAEIAETLLMSGNPCLSKRVLEETMPDYQQEDHELIRACKNEEHDAALLAQEREKWEREQKASSTTVLSEDEVFFDVTPDPAGYRIYINFYNAGTFSIELSTEQLGRLQRQIYKLLPPDKYEKASSAIEDITPEGAAIIQQVKKQAREDVLKDILNDMETYGTCSDIETERNFCKSLVKTRLVESMRSEVKK